MQAPALLFLRAGPLATPIDHVETVRTGPARRASHNLFHATISFSPEVCPYYLTIWTLAPAAGLEPAYHLISLVPTAPSRRIAGLSRLSRCRFCLCVKAADERLPRVRIPIRFRGISRASTLWAAIWARMRSVRAARSNPFWLGGEPRECMKCASHVRW